jgi:transglutaminase-like putative cysteine protease
MHFDLDESDTQPAREVAIPSGAGGVRVTLRHMARLAREYSKNPRIRATAEMIVRPIQTRAYRAEVDALHAMVQTEIRYTRDPLYFETLSTPTRILDVRVGDCDDMATLLAALLLSIGHPVRFVAMAQERGAPPSHVYVETKVGMTWIPLDPTEPEPSGWEPPQERSTRMIQDV